ncbi:hypothetical protein BDV19DRAFT_393921 [Aspergillus venezuelensis]
MSAEAISSVSRLLKEYPPKPWYRDAGALRLYAFLFPEVLFVSATTGYEGSMLNGLQALTTFNDFVMFVAARILLGLSASSAGNCGLVLVAELAHPRGRKFLTVLYNGLYYVGAIMAAWITYGTFPLATTYAWCIPSYLQGAVALINFSFILRCPKSSRSLIAQGRQDEAHLILAKAHSNGDLHDPIVMAEMEETSLALQRETISKSSWRGFFTSPVHRKRLFLLIFIGTAVNWSGNGLISYYLFRVLDTVGVTSEKSQTLINVVLQIVSFVICIIASWVTSWVARRTQFLNSTAVMFISLFSVTVANSVTAREKDSKPASITVIFFISLFMCGYNWAFNLLAYADPVELLPYNIRVIGLSFLNLFCDLAVFSNTWVNPVGLQNITWQYYIIYVLWLAVEFAIVFFTFPETLGYALEEFTAVLDNNPFLSFKHQAKHQQGPFNLDEEHVGSRQFVVVAVEGGQS